MVSTPGLIILSFGQVSPKRFDMLCYIYKSGLKSDHYLYLDKPMADAEIPAALRALLGSLQKVMELELEEGMTLAQADVTQVMDSLKTRGYFLQMPVKDMQAEEDRAFM